MIDSRLKSEDRLVESLSASSCCRAGVFLFDTLELRLVRSVLRSVKDRSSDSGYSADIVL